MSEKYKIRNQSAQYFVTFTTVQWLDVFTRTCYADIFLDSVRYCEKYKGLEVYAWCIMSNHIHMIIGTHDEPLNGIIRDLKSYTSKKIVKAIFDHPQESRKGWLLWLFEKEGEFNCNNINHQFWQQKNRPIELNSPEIAMQKLHYIHNNPVKAGIVNQPYEYRYSSAIDYEKGTKGMLNLYKLC